MTMNASFHPDDQRLAAFAELTDVAADDPVAAHVDGCTRCALLVADLRSLQVALSGLPDKPPSRPLQLVPPVPAGGVVAGGGGLWMALRRLVVPAYALGIMLLVAGFIGMNGLPGATAGGAPVPAGALVAGSAAASAAASDATGQALGPDRNSAESPSASPATVGGETNKNGYDAGTGKQTPGSGSSGPDLPLLLLGLGAILVVGASGVLVVGRVAAR
jgi:hypothetical protein